MKNKEKHQAVTSFFYRVVSAVMGCLFGCLRVKDSTTNSATTADASVSASSDVTIRKRNRLSTLMLTESMIEEDLEIGNRELVANGQVDVDMNELKEEAKFLKAWGTLPETPNEIRKMSREGKSQVSGNGNPEDSKSSSWLIGMPIGELDMEKELCQPPTPAQKGEESVKGTVSSSIQNSGTISSRSDEGNNGEQSAMPSSIVLADQSYKSASVVQGRKYVHFSCDHGTSTMQNLSPEIDGDASKDLGAASNRHNLKADPYPTPLRLNDEMQTPGTVFSAYQDGMANGKKNRIRSQYVKSVRNPVENLYEQGMKAEVSELSKRSAELEESVEEAEVGQCLSGKELNMVSNRASWPQSNATKQDKDTNSTLQENVVRIRTLEDRPILGMVAAHWTEDEPSHVSPISWDGNGIPNSTSKYKEDQKVSWHSTPFVERLEKALSEDPSKSGSGRSPTEMSGREESDTPLSKLRSSVNSIASC